MQLECIFLDRDGVINVERADYVKDWGEFEFLPNALAALRKLAMLNVPIIVITNQSAIGRKATTLQKVTQIHEKMVTAIRTAGGRIDDIMLCPHHPEEQCECRKPKPGMLFRAARVHGFNLSNTLFIGDSITDAQAAFAANCHSLLVRTGRQGSRIELLVKQDLQSVPGSTVEIVDTLEQAVSRLTTRAALTHN